MSTERETVTDDNDSDSTQARRRTVGEALRPGPMSPERRRLLLRALVVAIALVVFVGIPGYLAIQPGFVQRYPNLAPKYQTWSTSVHAEVPCRDCHVAPDVFSQGVFAARMVGEFYVTLVVHGRKPTLFGPPLNSACQSCHVDLRTVSPSGDLNIPHQAHVVLLKLPCIRCHTYLVHDKNPEGTHTPRMVTCLKCHNGTIAKSGCPTCHTNKAIPASHKAANWTVIHPLMQTKINCKQCHAWTANWCAACHAIRPASHTADWRKIHGAAVKAHRNCEACHTAAWCIKCHGMVPQLNFNPALKLVQ